MFDYYTVLTLCSCATIVAFPPDVELLCWY